MFDSTNKFLIKFSSIDVGKHSTQHSLMYNNIKLIHTNYTQSVKSFFYNTNTPAANKLLSMPLKQKLYCLLVFVVMLARRCIQNSITHVY